MLFYSGAVMAPLTALNTPSLGGPGGLMPGLPEDPLFDASLLDYAKGLTASIGFNSSAVNPNLPSSYESKLDHDILDIVKDWSTTLSTPSPSIMPEIKSTFSMNYGKIADQMLGKTFSAQSQTIGASTFNHDWSSINNVNSFSSPSSTFLALDLPSWKPEPYTPPKLPEFKTFKEIFDRVKPQSNILPTFKFYTFETPQLPDYKQSLNLIGKEPLYIYPFSKETELHIHESCSGANLQISGKKFKKFNCYEAAMFDYQTTKLDLPYKLDSCNKYKGLKRYFP